MNKARRQVGWWMVLAAAGGCAATGDAPFASEQGVARVEHHGLAVEFNPAIDRITFFGAPGRENMLHVADLKRPVPADGSYTFWGGCYTWVSPQMGRKDAPGGWIAADRVSKQNWPPDPAMDIGPARRTGGATDSISFTGPDQRSGLREEKTIRPTGPDSAELTCTLRNRGPSPVVAGTWVLTASSPGDMIAVRMPEGTELWGWGERSIGSFRSIASEPDARGWVLVNPGRATWNDGIKVFLGLPGGAKECVVEIAVWRRSARAWLHRTIGVMSAKDAARLRESGEGPVALYIHPRAPEGAMIESQLYGPIVEIEPDGTSTTTERWRVIRVGRADTSVLP